jgi:hypothetical protein
MCQCLLEEKYVAFIPGIDLLVLISTRKWGSFTSTGTTDNDKVGVHNMLDVFEVFRFNFGPQDDQ